MIDAPKTRLARDQIDAPWIVYLHNGEWWAIGVGSDDLPMVRQVHKIGGADVVDVRSDNAPWYRELKYIEEP